MQFWPAQKGVFLGSMIGKNISRGEDPQTQYARGAIGTPQLLDSSLLTEIRQPASLSDSMRTSVLQSLIHRTMGNFDRCFRQRKPNCVCN